MNEDLKYGIPQLKKYPMPDKQHVLSAIKFFNYVSPKYEKQLANAILARMKEYGMSFDDFGVGEDNRFHKYVPEKYLAHHGILGMKWGVRRYQNKDGSLTELGKKRYEEVVNDAKKYGENHAYLERSTREFEKDIKKGYKLLVPSDVKANYAKAVDDFIEQGKYLHKKYGEFVSDVKSMDDGYDYICTIINTPELGGGVEYMSLIGKTKGR